jgi:DNA-binding MarR family transcriptional regulator
MPSGTPDRVDRVVADWRRERPDLDVAPLALVGRLFLAVQLADAALAAPLREHGLQAGWLDVLAALRRAGPPYALSPGELMHATMLSSGGMTKRLDRLVEAGLVERRPDADDRRSVQVRLTRRGKATIDEAMELHVANERRLLKSLSAAEERTLDALLRKLIASLE